MSYEGLKTKTIDSGLTVEGLASPFRGLSECTIVLLNIRQGKVYNRPAHIFQIGGEAKIRWLDYPTHPKDTKCAWYPSEPQQYEMFGLSAATDFTKPVVLTEGEYDIASCYEVGFQGGSIGPATCVEKRINHDKELLLKYPYIILALDNDEAGRTATEKAKQLLPIDRLRIVDFKNLKDANEVLVTDKDVLRKMLESAKEIRPDGIVFGNELDYEKIWSETVRSVPLPWPQINQSMNGLEYGCLYLFLAGTGIGKSTVLRELGYYYRTNKPELKIANLFLEENNQITPLAYMALAKNIPLGHLRRNHNLIPEHEREELQRTLLDTEHMVFIDTSFKKESNNILQTIEYLVTVKKFDLIIIDHISYIIGRTGISKHGERRDIDEFIYKLQDLVQRLNCIIVAVSHVNESKDQKDWDKGAVPSLYSGRGSRVLAQVPDGIIGLSRNMTDDGTKDCLDVYNLKNRWFSRTGKMDRLIFIDSTGRLE